MAVKRKPGRPRAGAAPGSRAALLDAAAKVFASHGYGGASVDRIVQTAGLSKGTFYWHFESKEELFLALVEERIDAPARALIEVTRTAPAETPTAPTVSRGLAELFSAQRDLLVLLHEYWAAAVRDAGVRRRYRRRQRELVGTLAGALRARHDETGVPLTIPAERLATAFVALAQGLALEAAVDPDAVDGSLYGEILSLVYDGIASRS
jgi:AcrR family transcriptional regulator